MERKTFILLQNKDFRRSVRLFLKDKENKVDARRVKFTTEHKVSEKERNTRARKTPAEYSTSDEKIYDGLLRSHGYGKTFVLKDDPKGKLKREPFDITPVDARKAALKNMFDAAGLEFDINKSNEVLEEEYRIQVGAKTGVKIEGSTASEIPHVHVDVEKELLVQANDAREAYKAKYNEDIPDEYKNDLAFLSALSSPKFDAKAYMGQSPEDSDVVDEGGSEETIEELREQYLEAKGVNVPTPKKNDKDWIKKKLTE